ncbi:hypothetical protein AUH73_03025 [archaeon 13_1_40CM_4_53_4]|nr:MAG: hypothetical protein AUI07_08365 [archaeon 13_2_20CM_2_53_6]OLC63078.1 MAG: hypothetical protein AUH73_03025 [archaeon 13_1_40CM_4_53_4]OLE59223.1 MAG: hypothetical protein AUG17_03515 [Crenarchaeota archaeon 13_1_20CM_2_53_14]TMI25035.1 MAG: hypothetical protein E6H24_05735 [Candidatus Bathyarchaeota archaeon]
MRRSLVGSYGACLEFAYDVGMTADAQNHHPELTIRWRRVRLSWSTHSIGGLSQNDMIMAAKSESEYGKFNDHPQHAL